MGRAWGLAGAYAGSIIGAGFASGQELFHFFGTFGALGLWGMGLAGLLFTLIGGLVFELARKIESDSHHTLILRLFGKYVGYLVDAVLTVFLFGTLGVMLAAAGALFSEQLGLSFSAGVILTALLTGAISRSEPRRILRLNGLIVAVLVLLTFIVLVPVITHLGLPVSSRGAMLPSLVPANWLAGAVLYSSFNVVLALSPLSALGRELTSKAEAFLGAAIGSALLVVTGGIMLLALLQNPDLIADAQLPLLVLIKRNLPPGAALYTLVLYLALLTSCVAITYGLGHRLAAGHSLSARRVSAWLPLLAIPLAYLGFGNLVQSLYPVIGYTGVGLLCLALIRRHQLEY